MIIEDLKKEDIIARLEIISGKLLSSLVLRFILVDNKLFGNFPSAQLS